MKSTNYNPMKKIFRIIIFLILGILLLLALTPYLFKDEIQAAVKDQINESVNAKVEFANADLSFLKSFPQFTVMLDNLTIDGEGSHEGTRLVSIETVQLTTDFKSVIKASEGMTLNKIIVTKPIINLKVNADGKANYDIMKDKTDSKSESSFFGEIESYEIKDGELNYEDGASNILVHMDDLNHSGSGKFQDVVFDLETQTDVGEIDIQNGSLTLLSNATIAGEVDLGVNLDKRSFTLKENNISLNDLDLSFTGLATILEEGYDLDLQVLAPNNKVSSILSVIPSSYKGDLDQVKSEGNSYVKGWVKGIYSTQKTSYPSLNLSASIENGTVQYPGLSLPIKDINLDLIMKADRKDWSDFTIDAKEFTFLINQDKVVGKMKVVDAMNNPSVAGLINGSLNLKELAQAFPLEAVTLNDGYITTNMNLSLIHI